MRKTEHTRNLNQKNILSMVWLPFYAIGHWSPPKQNTKCLKTIPSETYTNNSTRNCRGFEDVDVHECKKFCWDNMLPDGCKPLISIPQCNFVIYHTLTKSCHLAMNCTEQTSRFTELFELKTQGKPFRMFLILFVISVIIITLCTLLKAKQSKIAQQYFLFQMNVNRSIWTVLLTSFYVYSKIKLKIHIKSICNIVRWWVFRHFHLVFDLLSLEYQSSSEIFLFWKITEPDHWLSISNFVSQFFHVYKYFASFFRVFWV